MAVDMFMKIGDFKGESEDKVHKEKIDVLAWSWGLSNSGTTHSGGGGGAGKANVQDLSFTKYVDSCSHNLIQASFSGKHVDKANLIVRKAGGKGAPVEYIKIEMTEVLITSVSTGGSGGEDRLTENVTLNFAEVTFDYTPQDSKGTVAGDKTFAWNIAENVAGG
ncbi:type VI secretion system tube protein Hcp [Roseateles sp.]|uniref:Hcp family type VI secretion system effector n=1 Tax=Roseateles sp. TaxID=1971397 RepID=UPI00286A8800|nr:type VI secretion system tube protein Hcp [Roseateles sp.]